MVRERCPRLAKQQSAAINSDTDALDGVIENDTGVTPWSNDGFSFTTPQFTGLSSVTDAISTTRDATKLNGLRIVVVP